ncbi:MAG TPA: TIM barrel protein, partial [bacterium]|nr:TIM barrel protein [bacterium]
LDALEQVLSQLRTIRTAFHLPIIEEDGWDFSCRDRQKQIDATIALLQQHHHRLGLTQFIAHPPEPCPPAGDPGASLDTLFNNVARLPLPLYFENVAGQSPESLRDFLQLARARLGEHYAGMCYDAAHFQISGLDPVEQFLAFREEIGAVHLSDCVGREDSHLPFNSGGNLPILPLLRAMHRSGYDGSITLEIRPRPDGDLAAYIRSYLLLLQHFAPARYLGARLRFLAAASLIRKS